MFIVEKENVMIVFSATISYWLKKSLSRYMSQTNKSFINLIGDSQQKTAINVQHLSFKLNNIDKRAEIVLSLFEKYSNNINKSQSIVFCQTKQECDLLAKSNEIYSISSDNFPQGKIRLLIITDASVCGLDIPQFKGLGNIRS
ncbi:unnamed protein product [Rotaria sp. Silwood2]|nr:unnamed protein product [Rotaria sp. Silwood2]CAF4371998.1 unnamed protein product [Rotaria sp. Silwood2]CAF4417693.1 unnamed protein product [Rotaria sp. Silwood2]